MNRMFGAAMALFLAAGTAHAQCDSGEKVVKFSHVSAPTGNPKGEMAAALAARVNTEMNGSLCMQVFPSSQLYNDNEVMEALLLGDAQLAAPDVGILGAYTKKLEVFNLPFLFQDMAAVDRFVKSDAGQGLLDSMKSRGLVGLGYLYNGLRVFSANKPLLVPADVKGLKIRVPGSDVSAAMIEALGASVQKLSWNEAFGALQTKVVDGQENTWSNVYTGKLYEVQDGITETNHQFLTYIILSSSQFMDDLKPAVRDQFQKIIREITDEYNDKAAAINEAAKAKVKAAGVEVRILTPEQRQLWLVAMKPVWAKFEPGIGSDVVRAAVAANKP